MPYRVWTRRLALCIASALLMAGVMSAQELPKAPQAQIFTLTPSPGPFTEPAIAVNPTNPQQVVGVYQDNVHAAYSEDAGHTWQAAEGADPKNYRVSGDVSVAFDNQGHAFLCYIAFDKLGTFNYWARGATRNGILCAARWMVARLGRRSTSRSRNNRLRR